MRAGTRGSRVYVLAALTVIAAACGPSTPPAVGSVPAAPATPGAAAPAPSVGQDIDTVVGEMSAALEAARGLRDALRQASADPNWDRVVNACQPYPLGPVDAAFGVRLTQGLRSQSRVPAWWVDQVAAVDTAAATTCFVTGSASAIPPGSRVEAGGLTTAEIALQPLQAALDDVPDGSPQKLRTLVEARRRPGT